VVGPQVTRPVDALQVRREPNVAADIVDFVVCIVLKDGQRRWEFYWSGGRSILWPDCMTQGGCRGVSLGL